MTRPEYGRQRSLTDIEVLSSTKKRVQIAWYTICGVLSGFVMFVLGVSMYGCPANPNVATYMTGSGACDLAVNIVNVFLILAQTSNHHSRGWFANFQQTVLRKNETEGRRAAQKIWRWHWWISVLIQVFWMIYGSVQVFGISPTYSNPYAEDFCQHGPFTYAYAILVIGWIVLLLCTPIMGCLCCFGITAYNLVDDDEDYGNEENQSSFE